MLPAAVRASIGRSNRRHNGREFLAAVLGQGPRIDPHDLSPRIVAARSESRSERISYRDAMDAYRRQLVMSALAQAQGNRAAAARALGLHEKYLLRLLKSLRITE